MLASITTSPSVVHPPVLSPAAALWNQKGTIGQSLGRLEALYAAVDRSGDLTLAQLIQWFAVAMEFRPDLIIELGRLQGNSTCALTEAANQLGGCRVVSLCVTNRWDTTTRPKISRLVSPSWFSALDARVANILTTDMQGIVGDAERVLVLWDAHGFEVANCILGSLMPALQHRHHVVLMHDISDTRYAEAPLDYGGKPVWHGGNSGRTRLVLGHLNSAVEQVIAIVDFVSRNRLTLHSSDESFHTELPHRQLQELKLIAGRGFSQRGDWFWFSLNELPDGAQATFPHFDRPRGPRSLLTALKATPLAERIWARLSEF